MPLTKVRDGAGNRSPLALLVSLVLLAACAPTASPSTVPRPTFPARLRLVVADLPSSQFYVPVSLAAALKYFDAEGLAIDLHFAPDGNIPTGTPFSAQTIDTVVRQRRWRAVAFLVRTPALVLLARSDLSGTVSSLADLKGRRIGVGAIGSHAHIVLTSLLARAGLSAADYAVVPIGTSTLAQAFATKAVDAAFAVEPHASQALRDGGGRLLADLRDPPETERLLGGGYPFTALLASEDLLRANPDAVQKAVNALTRAQIVMRQRTPEAIAELLPDEVTGADKRLWVETFKSQRGAFAPDGYVSASGMENVVNAARLFGLLKPGESLDPMALFDNTFAEQAAR